MIMTCDNCKYEHLPSYEQPCIKCMGTGHSKWEPKEEKKTVEGCATCKNEGTDSFFMPCTACVHRPASNVTFWEPKEEEKKMQEITLGKWEDRSGKSWTVVCVDRPGEYPVIAFSNSASEINCFTKNGRAFYSHVTEKDLIKPCPDPKLGENLIGLLCATSDRCLEDAKNTSDRYGTVIKAVEDTGYLSKHGSRWEYAYPMPSKRLRELADLAEERGF